MKMTILHKWDIDNGSDVYFCNRELAIMKKSTVFWDNVTCKNCLKKRFRAK